MHFRDELDRRFPGVAVEPMTKSALAPVLLHGQGRDRLVALEFAHGPNPVQVIQLPFDESDVQIAELGDLRLLLFGPPGGIDANASDRESDSAT